MIGANERTPQSGQRRSYERRTMKSNSPLRRTERFVPRFLLLAVAACGLACGHRRSAASPAAALLPPPAREPGPAYRIQLGDEMDVKFLYQPDMNEHVPVRADGKFSAARVDMGQVVEHGVPERVRLHPNDVVFVPATWISDMDDVVDAYVRGLIPALPRVGVGYSLSQ